MRKISYLVVFLLFYSQAFGDTLWVNPAGSNTSPYDTKAKGASDASTAFAVASSGDTIIYADGTYSDDADRVRGVPSGNAGPDTIDGTADDVITIVRAETEFGVTLSGMTSTSATAQEETAIGIAYKSHIDIIGFLVKHTVADVASSTSAISAYHSDYIRIMRCGVLQSDFSSVAHYGGGISVSFGEYNLIENCFVTGDLRYGIEIFGADESNYNIVRQCVVRWDYSGTSQPRAAIANYGGYYAGYGEPLEGISSHNYVQNCIVIDSQDGSEINPNTFTGGFSAPAQNNNLVRYGCISINNPNHIGYHSSDFDESHSCLIDNSVAWDNTGDPWASVWFNRLDPAGASGVVDSLIEGGFVRGSTDVTNDYAYRNISVGENHFISIAEGTGDDVNVEYDSRSAATDAGLAYLVQSHISGKGPTILKKMGVSGTYYGQTGWNTLTDEDLWPFPYEAEIKALFSEANPPHAGAAPATNNTLRGFCSTDANPRTDTGVVTLTSYIWEYLGNEMPSNIYDAPTPPESSSGSDGGGGCFAGVID